MKFHWPSQHWQAVVLLILSVWTQSVSVQGGKSAVTFSGGGLRSHAAFSGIVAGMMAKAEGEDGNAKLANVFKSTDAFGTVSGGTWFFSHLAYSRRFVDILASMANELEASDSGVYGKRFIAPFEKRVENHFKGEEEVPFMVRYGIRQAFPEDSEMIIKYLTMVLNAKDGENIWSTIIEILLDVFGDLDSRNSAISSKTNSWARSDQIWAAGGSFSTPELSDDALIVTKQNCISKDQSNSSEHSLAFSVNERFASKRKNKQRGYPISFSTKLGDEKQSAQDKKVFDFCPGQTEPFQARLSLYGPPKKSSEWVGDLVQSSEISIDLRGMETTNASLLNANFVSSGFVGGYLNRYKSLPLSGSQIGMVRDIYSKMLNLVPYFAVRAQASNDQLDRDDMIQPKNFQAAQALRSSSPKESCSHWLEQAATKQLAILADGAGIDNTGVANLLQDPLVDQVTIFLADSEKNELLSLKDLFRGLKTARGPLSTTYLPIFKTPARKLKRFARRAKFIRPVSEAQILKGMKYFTMKSKTVKQPAYKINAGRTVTLNVVLVQTDVGMVDKDLLKYNKLSTEIVASLRENTSATQELRNLLI